MDAGCPVAGRAIAGDTCLKVAPPVVGDVTALVKLAQLCHLESRFARLPYDGERVAARFSRMIERPLSTAFVVAERHVPGEFHGLMLGTIDEFFSAASALLLRFSCWCSSSIGGLAPSRW